MVYEDDSETKHVINDQPKQTISYSAQGMVGMGTFEIIFHAKCIETYE